MFLVNSVTLRLFVEAGFCSKWVSLWKYVEIDSFPGDTISIISSIPASTASSITNCNIGLSNIGSISLGIAFVIGKNRVPSPAAGIIALVIGW